MKRISLLLMLVGLLGCTRYRQMTGSDSPGLPQVTIMLAGQSNMERIEWYAQDALKNAYVQLHGPTDIVLVPCSVGGTWSGQWVPGSGLFEQCVEKVKATKRPLTHIAYWQGESDAYNEITYWDKNFLQTIRGFRSIFGNVPVVFAQIAFATDPDWNRGWADVQRQQAGINESGVKMVRTQDLAVLSDAVHINKESAVRIVTERFAPAL